MVRELGDLPGRRRWIEYGLFLEPTLAGRLPAKKQDHRAICILSQGLHGIPQSTGTMPFDGSDAEAPETETYVYSVMWSANAIRRRERMEGLTQSFATQRDEHKSIA